MLCLVPLMPVVMKFDPTLGMLYWVTVGKSQRSIVSRSHTGHNLGSHEGFTQYVPSHVRPFLFGYHISFYYFFALEVVRGLIFGHIWKHVWSNLTYFINIEKLNCEWCNEVISGIDAHGNEIWPKWLGDTVWATLLHFSVDRWYCQKVNWSLIVENGDTNEILGSYQFHTFNHYSFMWYSFCLAIIFHSVTFFTWNGEGSCFLSEIENMWPLISHIWTNGLKKVKVQ